jgi:hypothetical protein
MEERLVSLREIVEKHHCPLGQDSDDRECRRQTTGHDIQQCED